MRSAGDPEYLHRRTHHSTGRNRSSNGPIRYGPQVPLHARRCRVVVRRSGHVDAWQVLGLQPPDIVADGTGLAVVEHGPAPARQIGDPTFGVVEAGAAPVQKYSVAPHSLRAGLDGHKEGPQLNPITTASYRRSSPSDSTQSTSSGNATECVVTSTPISAAVSAKIATICSICGVSALVTSLNDSRRRFPPGPSARRPRRVG